MQPVTFTTSHFNPLLSGGGGGCPIPFDLSCPISEEVASHIEGGWVQRFETSAYKFPDSEKALADAVEAAGMTLGSKLLSMSEFLMSSLNESYQSRCGHCKKLTPEYEKAASILSSHDPPIVIAKVDANEDSNKGLASSYDVKGFPTLKIFRNGGKDIQEYKGPREAEGIVTYLKKQSGPASVEIKSAEDSSSLIGENKVVIVSAIVQL